MKLTLRSIILAALLLASNIYAAEPPLSETTIANWMKSQSALEVWGKKNQAKLEASSTSSTEDNPISMTPESMVAPLKAAGLYESANRLVAPLGFSSIDEWAAVTLRVTKAAAAIELEAHPEMLDNSQLEALRNAPEITSEQKKALAQAIEQNLAIAKEILSSSNEADKEAVKPHLERILQLMEEPY